MSAQKRSAPLSCGGRWDGLALGLLRPAAELPFPRDALTNTQAQQPTPCGKGISRQD